MNQKYPPKNKEQMPGKMDIPIGFLEFCWFMEDDPGFELFSLF
jgi:hypothetical protein